MKKEVNGLSGRVSKQSTASSLNIIASFIIRAHFLLIYDIIYRNNEYQLTVVGYRRTVQTFFLFVKRIAASV